MQHFEKCAYITYNMNFTVAETYVQEKLANYLILDMSVGVEMLGLLHIMDKEVETSGSMTSDAVALKTLF